MADNALRRKVGCNYDLPGVNATISWFVCSSSVAAQLINIGRLGSTYLLRSRDQVSPKLLTR